MLSSFYPLNDAAKPIKPSKFDLRSSPSSQVQHSMTTHNGTSIGTPPKRTGAVSFGSVAHPSPTPTATPPMSKFIDLDIYDDREQQHAGWVLAHAIKRWILSNPVTTEYETTSNPRIIEIGPSTGTSTLPLVKALSEKKREPGSSSFETYHAIDIDQEAIERLRQKLFKLWFQRVKEKMGDVIRYGFTKRAQNPSSIKKNHSVDTQHYAAAIGCQVTGEYSPIFKLANNKHWFLNIKAVVADAMRYQPPDGIPYTHAVMQFSLSHFDAAGKSFLLDHLKEILSMMHHFEDRKRALPPFKPAQSSSTSTRKPDKRGFILITDEFLPPFHNPASEAQALWKHHGAVIFDALIKGNHQLAKIELEALYSGLHKTGDFKISCEEFEDLLWRKGLSYRKFKTFPLNGDLTPYPDDHSLKTLPEKEQQAIQLWQKHSPSLFESALKHKPTKGFQVPQDTLKILETLSQQFQQAGLTSLRPTLKPEDVSLTTKEATDLEVQKREEPSHNWGVYTYQIILPFGLQNKDNMQHGVSQIIKNTTSPEEAALALYQQLGTLEHKVDAIGRLTLNPPDRWYEAKGERIPSYTDLKTNPAVAKAWAEKVDFTIQAIDGYEALCDQRNFPSNGS